MNILKKFLMLLVYFKNVVIIIVKNLKKKFLMIKNYVKKLSIILMKDDEKRNKIIRDIYSNKKQVKLDKCYVKNCNNEYLNVLKEVIEIYNKKIKTRNINIPEININKINENDIPEFIIKFNQFINHIDYSK